jgi:hypothetical protein
MDKSTGSSLGNSKPHHQQISVLNQNACKTISNKRMHQFTSELNQNEWVTVTGKLNPKSNKT